MQLDTHELAWAAGFFDGEGCFGFFQSSAHGHPRRNVHADITQTHPEVLHRFQAAVGVGKVHGPYPSKQQGRSDVWRFQTGRFEHVQQIVAALWPWLSSVKRERASAMLLARRAA